MCTVNNKLIAEFMGKKHIMTEDEFLSMEHKPHYPTVIEDLKYDSDWNWLMEVVERINNTGRFEVVIQKGFCYVSDESNELTLSCPASNTIEATYQAVVEFIKWYNNE